MSIVCPKCKRPNSDSAPKCVYCLSSLKGAAKFEVPDEIKRKAERFLAERSNISAPKKTEAPDKPAKAIEGLDVDAATPRSPFKVIKGGKPEEVSTVEAKKSYWVISSPLRQMDEDVVKKASEILKIDPYIARNKLSWEAPWVVKRFPEAASAKELAAKLIKAGLDAYSITTDEFNAAPAMMKVTKVSLVSGGLAFEGGAEDQPVTVKWSEAFLIVTGDVQRQPSADRKKRLFKGAEDYPSEYLKKYEVLDIYTKDGFGLRVAEGVTNFSGLGKYMRQSSLRNMKWIQNGLEAGSSPITDDAYKLQGKIYRLPLKHVGAILMHGKKENNKTTFKDNSKHLDEYSTLSYIHHKRLSG